MADTAVCPSHPTESAIGNCARCGAFVCALDSRELDGARYCATCAGRPDVDWLEAFKAKHWGKRDGWAWLFGLGALPQAAGAVAALTEPEMRVLGALGLVAAAGGVMWWLKMPVARWLLATVLVAQIGWGAVTVHPLWLLGGVVPMIILLSVVLATRTRLFFELDVPREKVKAMWDVYANNLYARYALSLGIAGLIIWPFAPLAVLCGAVGLARVDLKATPPIGRRASAVAGLVLGAIGCSIGGFVVLQNL